MVDEPLAHIEGLYSDDDEDVFGGDDSDIDNMVTKEGRMKEDTFWSDEDENGKSVAGRRYLTGSGGGKKRPAGSMSAAASKTVPKKVGRYARPHRRRKAMGKAANDPDEDVMEVSDVEDDPDDF